MAAKKEKPASTTTPAELMKLIAAQAPALIAAGVTSLSIDGFAVTLAPPPEKPSGNANTPPPTTAPPPAHINPLKDPSTYPGGRIPGFTREDDHD